MAGRVQPTSRKAKTKLFTPRWLGSPVPSQHLVCTTGIAIANPNNQPHYQVGFLYKLAQGQTQIMDSFFLFLILAAVSAVVAAAVLVPSA